MPTLPKRKPEKARAPLVPAWHPNFRNFQRLPDTKPVRTVFFINGLAVVVALVLLLFVAYQEYALFTVNRQIAELEAQIERRMVVLEKHVTPSHEHIEAFHANQLSLKSQYGPPVAR